MKSALRPAAATLAFFLAACGSSQDRPDTTSGSGTGGANPCCTGAGGSGGGGGAGTAGGPQSGGSAGAGSGSGGAETAGAGGTSGTGSCETPDSASCPPTGPFGDGSEGSVIPDLTVYDCEGNPVTLHTLCDNRTAAVFTFAAWCSVCKAHMSAGEPQALYDKYRNESFEMYVVVTQKTDGTVADATLCQAVKDQYGLEMPVLFDKDNVLTPELGMAANSGALVMTSGNRVTLREKYGFDEMAAELQHQLCF